MSANRPLDVVVIGAGPAGAATAAQLARRGRSVCLVEGKPSGTAAGDHLPGRARTLLAGLGVWDRFEQSGALPSRGVVSSWSGEEPDFKAALFNPFGGGWHVDRSAFDEMLREHANDLGAQRMPGFQARKLERTGDLWLISGKGPDGNADLAARWLVDASGRSTWVGRQLGMAPTVVDVLFGFIKFWNEMHGEPFALIEACREGWWYSAALPGGAGVSMFMTDVRPGADNRWAQWWAQSRTAARFSVAKMSGPIRACKAVSQWSPQRRPDAWLPVGDALIARDPLSSSGLCSALESAHECAEAVDKALAGERDSAEAYLASLQAQVARYLEERLDVYGRVQRFDDAFWRQRLKL